MSRGLQELHHEIRNRTAELTQGLGRTPHRTEIAEALGVNRSVVLKGLMAGGANVPLDHPARSEGGEPSTSAAWLGTDDARLDGVIEREKVRSWCHGAAAAGDDD